MPTLNIEKRRKEAVTTLLKNMEATAADMRALIVGMPPKDLLGYIYAQRLMKMKAGSGRPLAEHDTNGPDDTINEFQFLLEYVHAVLASDAAPDKVEFDEAKCAELFELGSKLKEQAIFFAMGSSADTDNKDFGPDTADIEFQIKSTWVLLRGWNQCRDSSRCRGWL